MMIAVDGPAASGKGTIAKALGRHYNLPVLDTGLLYRAVGLAVLKAGGDPDQEADALAACGFADADLNDTALRSEAVGSLASRVSTHQSVRQALVKRQRDFATQPGGAILDGRDIATVIAPEAEVKLYVTASVAARAQRRFLEMRKRGEAVTIEAIEADLAARDARDAGRANAPLMQARDALVLDNSELSPEDSVSEALRLVREALGR